MYRVLLLISLLSSSLVFASTTVCPDNQCIAVVNAGNSGTRLHIYSYQMNAAHEPTDIKNVYTKKISSRLARTELNQKAIDAYASSLFSEIEDNGIPVYFYATSGMRKLSFAKQRAYYAKLTQWFSRQSQWELMAARTLTGREEALYGWLAVNYELGALSSATTPLVGVLDTGSASLQVAFPLTAAENMQLDRDNYLNIEVYGRRISLFVHGFLGLGQDEIRNQYLDHPVCFPRNYLLPNGAVAAGDFYACEKRMAPLINGVHEVDNTVKPMIQNGAEKDWYIIGGISAMLQERPFTFDDNRFTADMLSEKADRQLCRQSWSILGTIYPENKHLFVGCLNAAYFYALLVDGLGIPRHQPVHYIPQRISTNDWTLGVIFYPEGITE